LPPLASSAQATRAILLASAMATTLNGRRARSCVSQGYVSGFCLARRSTECAPTTRRRRRYRSPCLEIGPSFGLPPVESCRGTNPIQAAKSRPDRKAFGSVTVAVMALAPRVPIPGTGINGQTFIALVRNDRQQLFEPLASLRSQNPEFSQMRPQRIDHLGLLPHQKIACSMLHQPALLLGRLHLHKSHRRPTNPLTARFRVNRIVLAALHICLDVLRRHQTNLVTELPQLTCPVVRRGTGLHANQAGRQRREELQHLAAAKLLPDDDLLGRIDSVDLKHVFRDIQTDCGNLHVDGSLMWFVATITLRRFVAGSGRRPPHQKLP